MQKYLITALVALMGAIGAGLWWQTSRLDAERTKVAALTATVRQYASVIEEQAASKKRSDAALSTRLRAAEAEAKKRKEEYDALNKALAASGEWAAVPVPDSVANWLRHVNPERADAPRASAR